jgi:predicted nucleic acid-binding protein
MAEKVEFLVDTNIWLERLLNQERSLEVKEFLDNSPSELIIISDFSLHSIGVIMSNLKKFEEYSIFIDDLFNYGDVTQLALDAKETKEVMKYIEKSNLDFDDSYQYCLSEKYSLEIVSFDQDFIKNDIKVYTPKEALNLLNN